MKAFMVLAAFVAVASGQYDYTGPQQRQNGGAKPVYGLPEQTMMIDNQDETYIPKLFKHVFVHTTTDEPVDEQARTIKVPGGDKHVNIIFVKTPSTSSSQQTEVILPEQDEHKNLVYVLLKKAEAANDIKIRRPQAKLPTKPEVYFIRYKGQEQQQQQNGGNGGYSQGPPSNGGSNSAFQERAPVRAPERAPVQVQSNGNPGNNNGYSEAGVYNPALAPGPIRSSAEAPSSGYGVPL